LPQPTTVHPEGGGAAGRAEVKDKLPTNASASSSASSENRRVLFLKIMVFSP
jgi:hypothetical protein